MKPSRFILLAALLLVAIGFLTACVEASKKTTMPDGTRIEEYSKHTDPNVLAFGGEVVRAYSPRRIKRVREEKSGRISAGEIYRRSGAYGPFLL